MAGDRAVEAQDDTTVPTVKQKLDAVFEELDEVLTAAEAHCEVRDWRSTLALLRTIISVWKFDSAGCVLLAGDARCQVILHRMRVGWQTCLRLATDLDSQARINVVNEVVAWDPSVEYRLPDEWDILFNERREVYFRKHPVEFALMEILELWEKLRRNSVVYLSTDGVGGDTGMTSSELAELSTANIAIVMSEAQRFTGSNGSPERIRKQLASTLVVNCRIRKIYNKVQVLLDCLRNSPGASGGLAAVLNIAGTDANPGDSENIALHGVYFWHNMRLQDLSDAAETIEALSHTLHQLSLEVVACSLAHEYRRQRRPSGGKMASESISEVAVGCEKQLFSLGRRVTQKRLDIDEAGAHCMGALLSVLESSLSMQQTINQVLL